MKVPASAATQQPLWRRLLWFVGLWLAGLMVVGSIAFLIRAVLRS